MRYRQFFLPLVLAVVFLSSCHSPKKGPAPSWPSTTNETHPWTRWWWHGSAVNAKDLTDNMEQLHEAGFGGLEITPIYGVKGFEDQDLSFQSNEWMDMFEHTLQEGKRLDLGIDLANASGWPFGGRWIQADDACKYVAYKQYHVKRGRKLTEKVEFIQKPILRTVGTKLKLEDIKFPISSNTNLQEMALDQVRFQKPLPLQTLMAYSNQGDVIDLTDKVDANGQLDWTAPEGDWDLYAVFEGWHGKMVERAGKGGEGNVIDHFSEKAAKDFLAFYDSTATGHNLSGLRAFFNDSYEVDDANGEADWTPKFFDEFKTLRGYDLREDLPALFGKDSEEMNSRVMCDYRETISDLLLTRFTNVWADWAKSHNALIRNQAHGSPAAILDLYEASGIPETEGTDPMRIKMATSAGHVSGKPLIACEAATWLDDHFLATLSKSKQNFDRYLANGVNHIVYHGTPYSPINDPFPGWMFYAAVHYAPTNSWWPDLKSLNQYVTNSQSFLQHAAPDNDLLLYFPIYDAWSERGRSMLRHFGMHTEELTKELSQSLLSQGYTFDYISDRQIQTLSGEKDLIKAKGATYKTILIPTCEYIPLQSMKKLKALAEGGATIIFESKLPMDVPGVADLKERQKSYDELIASIEFQEENDMEVARVGNGFFICCSDISSMLKRRSVYPEEMASLGLWFSRVERLEGTAYFICNWTDKAIDQWVKIESSGEEAAWFNPMNRAIGKAEVKKLSDSQSEVYLQLQPGETLILQWYPYSFDLDNYPVYEQNENKTELAGEWTVSFIHGGPSLPPTFTTEKLQSWPEISDELKVFSGTAAYKTQFSKPSETAAGYRLDLGEVYQSAKVILNGEELQTLYGPSYSLVIPSEKLKDSNELEIRVSNLMANRMIEMDKEGGQYKKFYNTNFAAHERENRGADGLFTAASWEPLPSGLVGPISLTPLQTKTIN
ncbi:alpha-L-rhamnosidase-like protein [Mangrovibacterium diazotrophicum]|uniref:Alpha-L-rhamnosidase-like protein n=2 Tax=Mangrovibacterium diazotrophicum TaxID=1261403 RepID=A0A419WB16_9BACT|nr:alpha-L-rhamnosidase-like protein [Mangrovibacterium diazotrophicum]